MDSEIRAGVVECSVTLLAQLLKLPKDHKITRIEQSAEDYYQQKYKIVLEGPSLPLVRELEYLPRVRLEFHTDGSETEVKF